MTKEENKKDVKMKESHKVAHSKRRPSKKKLVEGYRKRNRLVEIVIICIVAVVLFILGCNKTFLRTSYSQKVDNVNININLPRFTYFIGSDDEKIVFKTLRKSSNTRAFFEDYLNSDAFDIYYCGDSTPYYYNKEGKYFLYNLEVKKGFAIKTITVNYSTVDYNLFCNGIANDLNDTEDEL